MPQSLARCYRVPDPKLLITPSSKSFTRFRLAVADTQKKDEKAGTLWLTVLVWPEALAKVVVERVRSGSLVLVAGRLSERPYTNGEGEERTNLELIAGSVEFLGTGKPGET